MPRQSLQGFDLRVDQSVCGGGSSDAAACLVSLDAWAMRAAGSRPRRLPEAKNGRDNKSEIPSRAGTSSAHQSADRRCHLPAQVKHRPHLRAAAMVLQRVCTLAVLLLAVCSFGPRAAGETRLANHAHHSALRMGSLI